MTLYYDYVLEPKHDTRKSYYGKAAYREYRRSDRSRPEVRVLYSYCTPVCWIDMQRMEFHRLWCGWSHTTMRHVVEFCQQAADDLAELYGAAVDDTGVYVTTKAQWDALPVEETPRFQ